MDFIIKLHYPGDSAKIAESNLKRLLMKYESNLRESDQMYQIRLRVDHKQLWMVVRNLPCPNTMSIMEFQTDLFSNIDPNDRIA